MANSIQGDNFQPSTTDAVCIEHFSERDIVREDKAIPSDGSVLVVPRKIPKLTDDAVTSKFPNQLLYMSSECKLKSKGPEKRQKEQEAIAPATTVETVATAKSTTIATRTETATATKVVMDVIKTEPGVDPLSIRTSDCVDLEEKKPLLQYGNSVDLHMTEIKTETMDQNCDLKSEMIFPGKSEPFVMKCEPEKESCDWSPLEEEEKVGQQVSSEDEVSAESLAVIRSKGLSSLRNIAHDGDTRAGRKIYKCDICGKQVTHLALHRRVHSGEKPYRCDVCGKCFALQGNLRKHSVVHTNKRPFRCDVCGKNFAQSIQLKHHATLHTGDKAFTCGVCGKNFARLAYLKQHARLHTGDKPFKCDVCGKRFNSTHFVKRHERSHERTKLFRCHICGKIYDKLIDLKNHRVLHAVQQP
ncbi:uncharacterized protein [Periplaneta americana]|uniref:uncharacterized protein isoform X1 n=1 Tax=Periplaneta americana TaxID=6978 RepID=UPI0037E7CD45